MEAVSYSEVASQAEAAVAEIAQKIKRVLRSLGDPHLVRAQMTEPRIKTEQSLKRKACSHGWNFEDAITKTSDFIGFRIVCNNLQDASRGADLLEEFFRREGFHVDREDYVQAPKSSGYRAIHLTFPVNLSVSEKTIDVACEIQVRSLLQNAWAELSRADIYTEDVPASIERQARSLAEQLSRADTTAEKIRRRITRPRRGSKPKAGQPVTAAALAFVFRNVFGEDPPEYLIDYVLRETESSGLRTDGLHALLSDEQFVSRLKSAYHDVEGFDASPEQIFRWAVHALSRGKEAAVRAATREAREEWAEIRGIAQREVLPSANEFERKLASIEYAQKDDDPEGEIERWAGALEASSPCLLCGTPIINPDRLARAAARYYGKRSKDSRSIRSRVRDVANRFAVESGNSGLCSHCSYMLNKD